MRVLAFACALGCASAFMAPMPTSRGRRSAMRMSVDDLVGADTETGGVWDPLGLAQVRQRSGPCPKKNIRMSVCRPNLPCFGLLECIA